MVVTTLYTAAVRTDRLIKGIPHQFGSLTETTKCPASTRGETRQSFDWRGLALGHQAVEERREESEEEGGEDDDDDDDIDISHLASPCLVYGECKSSRFHRL